MPLKFDDIRRHTSRFEGVVPHMYLDTVGKVTVGVGNMLPSVAAAQKLAFVDRRTRQPATPEQIAADFEAVRKQPKGMRAARYARHTKLTLPREVIDSLLARRIESFEDDLRRLYTGYDEFPYEVRLALLDMAYNLGAGALKRRWRNLNAAIQARDWAGAARECKRRGVQTKRNDWTKELFETAARVTPAQYFAGDAMPAPELAEHEANTPKTEEAVT